MQNNFVFVVCGSKEHIDTLNLSLKALRKFSELPIWVVTDSKRNEVAIEHSIDQIIDVSVAEEYNHHRASIYLKTSLHRCLPMEDVLYCYLDTDIVALNAEVNYIFSQYQTPISFASDHCKMNGFSPQAVNCGCAVMPLELQGLIDKYQNQFSHLIKNQAVIDTILNEWFNFKRQFPLEQAKNEWFNGLLKNKPELQTKRAQLLKLTSRQLPLPQLVFNYLFRVFPNFKRTFGMKQWKDLEGNVLLDEGPDYYEFMSRKGFFFDKPTKKWLDKSGKETPEIPKTFDSFFAEKGFVYNSKEEAWYTLDGNLFHPNITKLIERNSLYWHDPATDTWYDGEGNRVFMNECNHLQDAIKADFKVDVKQADWQHWNGGVFLFDKGSIPFLDTWHKLTLEAFSLPYWKTRDQGTLIASVWKHGLQDHPLIPIRFNFIADYNHPTMVYLGNLTFRANMDNPEVRPSFVHIYHHWGDSSWEIWRDVEQHVSNKQHVT